MVDEPWDLVEVKKKKKKSFSNNYFTLQEIKKNTIEISDVEFFFFFPSNQLEHWKLILY